MNKLSKRLEVVASFVNDNSKVIDIGCDHGLLSIYLVNKYKNIKNWFYMTQRLFENSLTLYGKEWNDLVSYYLNYYTDALMDIYEKKREDRRKYLKVYRKVTGALLLKSRLFYLSRWLCFLDFTNLLSSLTLDVHTMLHPKNKKQ